MRTEEEMDLWIWSRGLDQWITDPYSSSTTVPHELDYLRGIHNCEALDVLSTWLSLKVGLEVRLRTMWQDKHIYVKPTVGKQRELADIAVISQRLKAGNVISRSMWILQAKVVEKPTSSFSGTSSKKEIELFEGAPPGSQTPGFNLLERNNGRSIGFFPAGAFCGPLHWSFLTLHRDPKMPLQDVLRDRWPGSKIVAPTHKSLCGSLVDVINGGRGAPVVLPAQKGDEWSRLFELLMAQPSGVTTGHATSDANPTGAVMQLSTLQLAAVHAAVVPEWSDHLPYSRWHYNHWLYNQWPHLSMRGSNMYSLADSGGSEALSHALQTEAFGEGANSPPEEPLERTPDEPGPGFPLTVFIDIGGND